MGCDEAMPGEKRRDAHQALWEWLVRQALGPEELERRQEALAAEVTRLRVQATRAQDQDEHDEEGEGPWTTTACSGM